MSAFDPNTENQTQTSEREGESNQTFKDTSEERKGFPL